MTLGLLVTTEMPLLAFFFFGYSHCWLFLRRFLPKYNSRIPLVCFFHPFLTPSVLAFGFSKKVYALKLSEKYLEDVKGLVGKMSDNCMRGGGGLQL